MMRHYALLIVLGLSHGISDGAAGLLLGSLSHSLALWQVGLLVLIYNALAFGGQPVAGFIVDQLRQPKLAAGVGLVTMALALLVAPWQPAIAAGIAGIGSALFHVGGGALALCVTPERAAGPSLFAAPGVVGLAIGGALTASTPGLGSASPAWVFILVLIALAGWLALAHQPPLPYAEQRAAQQAEPLLHGHEIVMLLLLAAIALRSLVWNAVQFLHDGQMVTLVWLALAAGSGKVAGGYLADRFGLRRWATAALFIAAPVLAFGGQHLVLLLAGVALLQSATAPVIVLMARALPRQPATAAGMALGLAIAAGGLPLMSGLSDWISTPAILLGTALLAAALLWWTAQGRRYVMRIDALGDN